MSIVSHDLPSPVQEQILRAIQYDKAGEWNTKRGLHRIVANLHGIEHLLHYFHPSPTNPVEVLFAGETKGVAVGEIKQSHLAQPGLHFTVTTLHEPPFPELVQNVGQDNIYAATTIENMEGVPDDSKDIVLSVFAAAYCVDEDRAVAGIKRVLAEGGVFKGVFAKMEDEDEEPTAAAELGLRGPEPFEAAFQRAGFDVAVMGTGQDSIIVAVKNGSPGTARALLDADEYDEPKQREALDKEGFHLEDASKYK